MRRKREADLNANVTRDDEGTIRSAVFAGNGPASAEGTDRGPAKTHVRRLAAELGIDIAELGELDREATHLEPDRSGHSFRLADEKTFFDSTTYLYAQTWRGTPVWQAGITATVRNTDNSIVSVANTRKAGVDAELPAARHVNRYRRLFAIGEKGPGAEEGQSKAAYTSGTKLLREVLGPALDTEGEGQDLPTPELISGRFYIYQLDVSERQQKRPEGEPSEPTDTPTSDTPIEHEAQPTLPLAPLPDSLQDGNWYLVAELIVRLPHDGHRMNWRLLVDVETNAILYVRSLTSAVNGLVYTYDPITSTGDTSNDAASSNAVLNPLRDDVVLRGLDPAVAGTQSLTGRIRNRHQRRGSQSI